MCSSDLRSERRPPFAAQKAADARSDEAFQKALPLIQADEKNGKPYIPWAAKPEDLPQAKKAIDVLAALVPHVEGELATDLRTALANLQVAYAEAAS